jgi:hypothetical protein
MRGVFPLHLRDSSPDSPAGASQLLYGSLSRLPVGGAFLRRAARPEEYRTRKSGEPAGWKACPTSAAQKLRCALRRLMKLCSIEADWLQGSNLAFSFSK